LEGSEVSSIILEKATFQDAFQTSDLQRPQTDPNKNLKKSTSSDVWEMKRPQTSANIVYVANMDLNSDQGWDCARLKYQEHNLKDPKNKKLVETSVSSCFQP
jgi:hypothetical protein